MAFIRSQQGLMFSLLLIFTLLQSSAFATTSYVDITDLDNTKAHLVVDYLSLSPDQAKLISSAEIHQLEKRKWQKNSNTVGGIDIAKGRNWFSIELINNAAEGKAAYLAFKNRFELINAQLFQLAKDNSLQPLELALNSSSLKVGLLHLPGLSKQKVYLLIVSDAAIKLPIKIISEANFYHYNSEAQYENGFVIGGMTLLALVMLLLFFASTLKSILLLFGYLLTRALLLSIILGGNLFYLFPNMPELRAVDLPLITAISLIFMVLFTIELFNLKQLFVSYHQRIKMLCWLLVISILASLFLGVNENFIMSLLVQGFVCFALVILGIILTRKAQPLASLFTLTLGIECAFLVISVVTLQINGLAFIDNQSAYFGFFFWLNAFLIVFMLSRQYAHQLQDKQRIQRQALASAIAAQQANEEILTLQQDNQEDLEVRVQERTLELNIALQELENSNRELALKNTQDDLTGLYNRRFYDQKILAEYRRSKRNLTPLSLVLIDIDHFKVVNDTHGHLAGDRCLMLLGKIIKDSLKRSTDLGIRYGGEEFCLILPDTDAEGAMVLAEALRESVADTACIYQDLVINLTISCGVSTYLQQDDVQPEQIFSGADTALYRAKNQGRNQIQQHDFAST